MSSGGIEEVTTKINYETVLVQQFNRCNHFATSGTSEEFQRAVDVFWRIVPTSIKREIKEYIDSGLSAEKKKLQEKMERHEIDKSRLIYDTTMLLYEKSLAILEEHGYLIRRRTVYAGGEEEVVTFED